MEHAYRDAPRRTLHAQAHGHRRAGEGPVDHHATGLRPPRMAACYEGALAARSPLLLLG